MPALSFGYTTPAAPTTYTNVGNVTDSNSGNEAAYETAHALSITGLSHTVAEGRIYHVGLRNGYGGNHSVGLLLHAVTFTGTPGQIRFA